MEFYSNFLSGDFAVLLSSGLTIKQALLMNFLSSLTAILGGIVGVALGTQWSAAPWIFALTAGLFVYIALVDMVSFFVKFTKIYNPLSSNRVRSHHKYIDHWTW